MIDYKKYNINIYVFIFSILLLLYFFYFEYSYFRGVFLYSFIISHNILLLYRAYRNKNNILFIFFLFIFSYSYVLGNFFIFGKQLSIYSAFNSSDYIYKTSCIFLLYLTFFQFFISINIPKYKFIIKIRDNIYIYIISLILAFFFMYLGKVGEFSLIDGGYGTSSFSNSKAEYSLIFFFIAFIFTGNKKMRLLFLYLCCFVYILFNVLYGGRIELLMMLLCIYIFRLADRISIKKIIIYAFLLILTLNVIGDIRSSGFDKSTFLLRLLKYNQESSFSSNDIVINNESDVFYATNRIISMTDLNIISTYDRINSFLGFVKSIFTSSSSSSSDISVLSNYKTDIYPVGGGGLIFGYFYVFFSYFGVIIIAIFTAKILSIFSGNTFVNRNEFFSIYVIYIFITLPRWFAYSPITLFKFSLYGTILSYLLILVDRSIKNSLNR